MYESVQYTYCTHAYSNNIYFLTVSSTPPSTHSKSLVSITASSTMIPTGTSLSMYVHTLLFSPFPLYNIIAVVCVYNHNLNMYVMYTCAA